ncbi:hypothetical protein SFRURICE_018841 [Spodoptera frugiperda]|nr:hypothetical protein SFRURICE_018841 [Spodoptera frugiperda]
MYLARHQNKLPAKIICLPSINDLAVTEAVTALEAALCSEHTVMVAKQELYYRNRPEKLADLAYAPMTESKTKTTKLQEVRIRDGIEMHEDVNGLETYFSFVDTDGVQQSSNIVTMSTKFGSDCLGAEEFDSSLTYICSMLQP